jgi:RES domain-containing protein
VIAWRVCKLPHDPWDGTGAALRGGRWQSPGRPVIYAADSYAGALLEILVHLDAPRRLPGAQHAIRLDIPDDILEQAASAVPDGWEQRATGAARAFGNRWLDEARTAALVVPALPSRPIGRVVLINPAHPDSARIARGAPFPVPWDERLF